MAAHRDDIEIVCGGTVIKLVDLGHKVGILDLTEGEMGTRGSAHDREKEGNCARGVRGEPHRPFKIIYATVSVFDKKPSIIVDITDQLERKIKAVKCYASQFLDRPPEGKEIFPPARDIYTFIEARARHYGYLIGKKYGEPFMLKETMEIEDPM